jgi:hypothetical protein
MSALKLVQMDFKYKLSINLDYEEGCKSFNRGSVSVSSSCTNCYFRFLRFPTYLAFIVFGLLAQTNQVSGKPLFFRAGRDRGQFLVDLTFAFLRSRRYLAFIVFESKQKHCKVMKDDLSHPYIAIGSETIK